MLTGDRAADSDAGLEDLATSVERTLRLLGIASIEQDQRMQVTVACVKYVANSKSILLADLIDLTQSFRNARAWNHPILDVIRGRNAANRPKCGLASLPQQLTLILVRSAPDLARVTPATQLRDEFCLLIDGFLQSLQLDEEHSGGIEGVAGMYRRLDGAQRPSVKHLESCRRDARRCQSYHRVAGRLNVVIDGQQGRDRLWQTCDLHRDRCGDAQRSLGTHKESSEIISGRARSSTSESNDPPIWQNNFQPGDMIDRYPIGQGMG